MAESVESKSIKQLAEENKKANERTIARLENIAASTDHEGTKRAANAQKQLDAIVASNETQKKLLNVNDKTLEKIQTNAAAMDEQKSIMDAQRKELEDLGIDADQDKGFQKEQRKFAKMELTQAKLTGSKDAEKAAKDKMGDNKMLGYLKKTAGFLGGIAKQGMEKVKSGLAGFSKFAFGALAIAALSFLNSPQFDKYYDQIVNFIVPALTKLYNEVIKPLAIYIKEKLVTAFKDIMDVISGKKGIFEAIMNNKVVAASIALYFSKNIFSAMTLLYKVIKGIAIAAKFVVGKLSFGAIFAKIGAAFAVVKTFFVATLMPFLSAFAIPILAIVGAVALIIITIRAIKKGFDDFMTELEATGSIWEATKTAIVSVISNLFGYPFDLIKDGVSWIIGKIGSVFGIESFKNAEKLLDSFSFVDLITNSLNFMGDAIAGLFSFISDRVQAIIRAIPVFGDKIADKLFGTEKDQKAEAEAKAAAKLANEMAREMALEDADIGLSPVGGQTTKIKQLSADIAKQQNQNQSAPVVVDAKQITTDNSSSNMTTGNTPVRNSNPFLSAFGNTSDFPRPA